MYNQLVSDIQLSTNFEYDFILNVLRSTILVERQDCRNINAEINKTHLGHGMFVTSVVTLNALPFYCTFTQFLSTAIFPTIFACKNKE